MDWHVSPRVWRADTLHWFCIEREWRKDWGDKRKKASARAWVGLNREHLWSFHMVRPSSCQQALTSSNQLSFLPLLAMWLNLTFIKEKKKKYILCLLFLGYVPSACPIRETWDLPCPQLAAPLTEANLSCIVMWASFSPVGLNQGTQESVEIRSWLLKWFLRLPNTVITSFYISVSLLSGQITTKFMT